MPRKARIDAPGALHHIIVRGIERKKIFRSDSDRKNLFGRLGDLVVETQADCFAWVFMDNHAHLLLRTGLVPIARVMARLLTGYAVSFNRKYRRHGQLFQNRYKSILCQEPGWPPTLLHLWPLIMPPPVLSLTRDEEEKRLGYSSSYPPSMVKI